MAAKANSGTVSLANQAFVPTATRQAVQKENSLNTRNDVVRDLQLQDHVRTDLSLKCFVNSSDVNSCKVGLSQVPEEEVTTATQRSHGEHAVNLDSSTGSSSPVCTERNDCGTQRRELKRQRSDRGQALSHSDPLDAGAEVGVARRTLAHSVESEGLLKKRNLKEERTTTSNSCDETSLLPPADDSTGLSDLTHLNERQQPSPSQDEKTRVKPIKRLESNAAMDSDDRRSKNVLVEGRCEGAVQLAGEEASEGCEADAMEVSASSCSTNTDTRPLTLCAQTLTTPPAIETNISNLIKGEYLYLRHARNQWFRVKLESLKGNLGRVRYCRSGLEVEVIFLENGMAISSEEFAITRWTFTTPGKRNVGVNLVEKQIVLSGTNKDTFTTKVYGFDVHTGASEVLSAKGRILLLLIKDNGSAFEFGTTREYSWSFATGHKIVGGKQVGKMISVEYNRNEWISGTVERFDKESQACKVVYENGLVDHLLIQANEIAR